MKERRVTATLAANHPMVMKTLNLLVALMSIPAVLVGQTASHTLEEAARHNWYVRAHADSSVLGEGRIQRVDSASVIMGARQFALVDISRLDRRLNVGGGWKAGAVVGTLSGAAFGTALAGLCESDCGNAEIHAALVFGGIGALIGGVLGQVIRPPRHTWKRVWP